MFFYERISIKVTEEIVNPIKVYAISRGVSDVKFSIFADTDAAADFVF